MFRKVKFESMQIQVCKCGGIHVCFGNVTVHMDKCEFMDMATKVEKTKNYLSTSIPHEVSEESREIH